MHNAKVNQYFISFVNGVVSLLSRESVLVSDHKSELNLNKRKKDVELICSGFLNGEFSCISQGFKGGRRVANTHTHSPTNALTHR